MKFLFVGLCAVVFGALINASPTGNSHQLLLGTKECTMGPQYWCENFSTAKNCHAVLHCIQTVWETRVVPEDDNPICKKCKEMVDQAREQLRSNETMDELRQVFEGSCKLIPIKEVSKECCKIADNFVPELVEALSSEMNPDQVCSVAGLCNNEKIHKLWYDYYKTALEDAKMNSDTTASITTERPPKTAGKKQLSCSGCNSVANVITSKFHAANRDVILDNVLHLCGKMSSFADGCTNIALVYFNDIYNHLSQNLDAEGICHMSGVCSSKYHSHPESEIEIQTKSDVGYVAVQAGEDIPCEMCEQLVNHLRELLVANTTEIEFKDVLRVLCSQTKDFKQECLSLVDQYYAVIYQNLVNNLDANGACFLIGVCPKGSDASSANNDLAPAQHESKVPAPKRNLLGAHEPVFTQQQISEMQLPIDKLMGAANPQLLIENGQLCVFCEYFLHFVQEALSTPDNEEDIKKVVKNRCSVIPKSIGAKCKQFVDEYGDAVIALLIQGLDPREVCPKLTMCPAHTNGDVDIFAPGPIDVSINSKSSESDKPTCPLCLLAMAQAQAVLKGDKSKKNVIQVLSNLCSHLPHKLKDECVDFVNTYSNELVDKLIGDFTPQEICIDIQLCTNDIPKSDQSNVDSSENEISDDVHIETLSGPNCLLCEEVVRVAEKKIVNKTSKEEIKHALENSCEKLKKTIREDCRKYVDKYGDKVADLIMKQMSPKLICREIGLCLWSEQDDLEIDEAFKYDIVTVPTSKPSDNSQCVLCEFIITKLETQLKDKKTQDEIRHEIKNICVIMPKTVARNCNKFMDQYTDMIIELIDTVPPKSLCQQLHVCLMGLDEIMNDDVVECGVCHGATIALTNFYLKHKEDDFENKDLISAGCENVPAKYYETCSDMLAIYGQSIMHLVMNSDADHSHICAQIGKCFEHEKSAGAYVTLLGSEAS